MVWAGLSSDVQSQAYEIFFSMHVHGDGHHRDSGNHPCSSIHLAGAPSEHEYLGTLGS